jgi:hypothetical protein
MATHVIPTVADARAAANVWLLDHLPDRFAAGIPVYEPANETWYIPVWLSYPGVAPLGPVGALGVDAVSGEVQTHTPLVQMKMQALALYDQHRAAIDAPLS